MNRWAWSAVAVVAAYGWAVITTAVRYEFEFRTLTRRPRVTLWTPPRGVALLKHHAKKRTVTLPDGTRALVTVDDSGTVTQVESAERLDAVVRPKSVTIKVRGR